MFTCALDESVIYREDKYTHTQVNVNYIFTCCCVFVLCMNPFLCLLLEAQDMNRIFFLSDVERVHRRNGLGSHTRV